MTPNAFLAGVVEGFYGRPWTSGERRTLLEWMQAWGLNAYLYAPKDDLKHRVLWREPYDAGELAALRSLIEECTRRGVRFVYGLGPGLDITYSDPQEIRLIKTRFAQMRSAGCRDFALLFDDIPDVLPEPDRRRWSSFAEAQAQVANDLFAWLQAQDREARLLFCPTPYCERMAAGGVGGHGYLELIGKCLHEAIDVLWTGPEIVSETIPVESIEALQRLIRRPPVLWDNLFANDYDGRRMYLGPYDGRAPGLRQAVRGILLNPNNEFPLNFVPLKTFAAYRQCGEVWNAREAHLDAVRQWHSAFTSVKHPIRLEDLLLLADCYYLPHRHGAEAQKLLQAAEHVVGVHDEGWEAAARRLCGYAEQVRRLFHNLAELTDRELFYALHRRIWDLNEELRLWELYVAFRRSASPETPFVSPEHLAGTYRGGVVARLQSLLRQLPDGSFLPTHGIDNSSTRPDEH